MRAIRFFTNCEPENPESRTDGIGAYFLPLGIASDLLPDPSLARP
jgi:hypothetical protein